MSTSEQSLTPFDPAPGSWENWSVRRVTRGCVWYVSPVQDRSIFVCARWKRRPPVVEGWVRAYGSYDFVALYNGWKAFVEKYGRPARRSEVVQCDVCGWRMRRHNLAHHVETSLWHQYRAYLRGQGEQGYVVASRSLRVALAGSGLLKRAKGEYRHHGYQSRSDAIGDAWYAPEWTARLWECVRMRRSTFDDEPTFEVDATRFRQLVALGPEHPDVLRILVAAELRNGRTA